MPLSKFVNVNQQCQSSTQQNDLVESINAEFCGLILLNTPASETVFRNYTVSPRRWNVLTDERLLLVTGWDVNKQDPLQLSCNVR